jgi:hypothetical protein
MTDPFRRAVDNHIQERKREQEERDRKRMECPHDGEIIVEERGLTPTAHGTKVGRYLCACVKCGQIRIVEPENE